MVLVPLDVFTLVVLVRTLTSLGCNGSGATLGLYLGRSSSHSDLSRM